jgi:hypothetical protein
VNRNARDHVTTSQRCCCSAVAGMVFGRRLADDWTRPAM